MSFCRGVHESDTCMREKPRLAMERTKHVYVSRTRLSHRCTPLAQTGADLVVYFSLARDGRADKNLVTSFCWFILRARNPIRACYGATAYATLEVVARQVRRSGDTTDTTDTSEV